MKLKMWKPLSVFVLLAFVAIVSAYDMYWAIKLQDSLYANELNPMVRWLMRLDGGDVALAMSLKMIGTITALSLTTLICIRRFSVGFIVCCSLALFQAFLLWFLHYGHLVV